MRKLLGAFGLAITLCLAVVPAAVAGQEIGDRCVADDSESGWTALVLNNALGYPELPPVVPPEGAKVITSWKLRAEPGTPPTQQQLVASRQVGEEDDVLVGASALETVVAGTNEFATRIPVPEYAHIGLRGPVATLFCDKLEGHLGGIVDGPWAIGEQRKLKVSLGFGVPVTAIVEDDRDGDGYGDETQDGCPRSAAYSGPCPVLTLTAKGEVQRRAILVTVRTSEAVEVKVWGQARWRKTGVKGKAGKVTNQLSFGIKKPVVPPAAARFSLPLRKPVLRKLEQIKPSQHVNAIVLANAYDLNGKPVLRKFELRIPGRD